MRVKVEWVILLSLHPEQPPAKTRTEKLPALINHIRTTKSERVT